MNAHALARLLLAGPDRPVGIQAVCGYDNDTEWTEVNGVQPCWSGGAALELVDETAEQYLERTAEARAAALRLVEVNLAEDTRNRIRAEELRNKAQAAEPADF